MKFKITTFVMIAYFSGVNVSYAQQNGLFERNSHDLESGGQNASLYEKRESSGGYWIPFGSGTMEPVDNTSASLNGEVLILVALGVAYAITKANKRTVDI